MNCTIELTNDQLAKLVCWVFAENGYPAAGISIWDGQTQLGFNRVVVHCEINTPIEVFPKPQRAMSREELNDVLYPNGSIGAAKFSGAA